MAATGCGRIMDGIGFLITPGAGRPFTTAAGPMQSATVGSGALTPSGDRPGFAGAALRVIVDGRPCLLDPDGMHQVGGSRETALGSRSALAWDTTISPSSRGADSVSADLTTSMRHTATATICFENRPS